MTQWLLENSLVALNTMYKENTAETSDIPHSKEMEGSS